MPYIETADELAEVLADLAGVYGCHDEERCSGGEDLRYSCRICWTSVVTDRIRGAVANEERLAAAERGGER
jgi:hypothetical protein